MSGGSGHGGSWAATAGVALLVWSAYAGAQDVLIVRGAYVYLVPTVAVKQMVGLAPRESWHQYSDFTRMIDGDGDGRADYIAIALGARGGFGAQIRYRLRYHSGTDKPTLGHWYWVAITDPVGKLVFERFSP